MIAIGSRLNGPDLPDQAAFNKDLVHRGPPQLRVRSRYPLERISLVPEVNASGFTPFVMVGHYIFP
jgi:hypothetical protein